MRRQNVDADERAGHRPAGLGRRGRCLLAGLVILAAVLRMGLWWAGPARAPKRAHQPDSQRYLDLSASMRTHHDFALGEPEMPGTLYYPFQQMRLERGEEPPPRGGRYVEIMRTPGYPAFLAGLELLGLNVPGILLVQCLLGSGGVLLVYLLGKWLMGSPRVGLAAGAILAVHPGELVSSNSVLTETLYAVLFMAAVLLAAMGLRQGRTAWFLLGGLALGAGALVRPVGMMLGPGIGLWVVLRRRRWPALPAGLALAAAAMAGPVLWMARNAHAGYGWQLTNVPPIHMAKTVAWMDMHAAGKTQYPEDFHPFYDRFTDRCRREADAGGTIDQAAKRLFRADVAGDPARYARTLADSTAKFMLDHSAPDLYTLLGWTYRPTGLRDVLLGRKSATTDAPRGQAVLALAWSGWNGLLALLMIGGMVRLAWRRQGTLLLLLGAVTGFFIFATQYHGMERMRLPILWVQALLVGWCLLAPPGPGTLTGQDAAAQPAATDRPATPAVART